MQFALLGRVEIFEDGNRLRLDASKQLAVIARLLIHPNQVVSTDEIAELLWSERPPANPVNGVQAMVSRMRRVLGADRLPSRGSGYLIVVNPGERDIDTFEERILAGERALDAGDPATAVELLASALGLWRGQPFGDFASEPFARSEVARLEEMRAAAIESRVEAELAAGHHAAVVSDLEGFIVEYPLRERLRGQLMVALYRCGRQAEALEVYKDTRLRLIDELGIEPNPELQRLVQAILLQDSSLERACVTSSDLTASSPSHAVSASVAGGITPVSPTGHGADDIIDIGAEMRPPALAARLRPRRSHQARALTAVLVVTALIGGAGWVVQQRTTKTASTGNTADSVAVIDPNRLGIDTIVPTGRSPGEIGATQSAVLVANVGDGTLSWIDVGTRRVTRTFPLGTDLAGVTAEANHAWTASVAGVVTGIDATYGTTTRLAALGRVNPKASPRRPMALGLGSLWVVDPAGLVARLDPASGRVLARVDVGSDPSGIAAGDEGAWVTNRADGTVSHIDATDTVAATIPVGHQPTGIVASADGIWVAVSGDNTVLRIDPRTSAVSKVIPLTGSPAGITVGAGGVWVTEPDAHAVAKIEPASGRVVATLAVPGAPIAVTTAADRVWVSLDQPPSPVVARAGTLRVDVPTDVSSLDPALAADSLSTELQFQTCVQLVTYQNEPGEAGTVLTPDAAKALPSVSDHGRRYTFVIRSGIRFAPPSNEEVTAETFRRVFDRVADPRMESPGAQFLADVVGGQALMNGRASHVTGVKATGDQLSIDLVAPAADFLARLSLQFFCAVPLTTPIVEGGVAPIPGAGPYTISSYEPRNQIVLVPNSNYRGTRIRRAQRIVVHLNVDPRRAVADVADGTVDYASDIGDVGMYEQMADAPALLGPHPTFDVETDPVSVVRYVVLNTRSGLFADRRWRLAASFAVDRTAMNAAYDVGLPRPTGALPNSGYLPPLLTDASVSSTLPLHPDLATARRYVAGRRGRAVLISCTQAPCPQQAQLIKRELATVGVEVDIQLMPKQLLFERVTRPDARWDITFLGWGADYADPVDVLGPLLDGRTLGTDASADWAGFRSSAFNSALDRLAAVDGPRRSRGYTALAAQVARDESPLIAYRVEVGHDFYGAAVGCRTHHPVFGTDLGALCVD